MNEGSRRALFVVPSAFPVGGLATWLDTVLPDLAAAGWETWLGLPSGRHSNVDEYLAYHPYPRVVKFANPSGTRLGRRASIEQALIGLQPAVVVNANVVDVFPAVSALRCRGSARPRVASSIHSLAAGLFADLDRFAGAIDAVVSPNALVAEAAISMFGMPPERVFRGSYGVEVLAEEPRPSASTLLDLLWIGRFEQPQKRVTDLPLILGRLDAMDADWRLSVAGAGPLEGWLRETLGAPEWTDRIHFAGAVTPDRVRQELLLPGRILLLTSEWELGPVVAWEAMGQGVVVVSTSFLGSGLEQGLVDRETALLFPVGDVTAAAEALAECRQPAMRTRLARSAWRLARDRYSRPRAAADWDRALSALCELEPRAASTLEPIAASGRLERAIGLRATEALRRTLGWTVRHQGSGDEWPHTRGSRERDGDFFARLRALDRQPTPVQP